MSVIEIISIFVGGLFIGGVLLTFIITLGFANLFLALCGMEQMGTWEAIKEIWKDWREK